MIILVYIALLVSFIAGIVISKQSSFRAGVMFFSIMIVAQIHKLFAPLYVNKLIKHYESLIVITADGITIGQLLVYLSYIEPVLYTIGFLILVIGLHRRWRTSAAIRIKF